MTLYSFRLYSISLCVLALSVTSANAQKRPPYPPDFVKSYIEACTAGRGSAVEAVCKCTLKKIENQYTIDEFQKINRETEETGQIPPALIRLFNSCQANPNSYKSLDNKYCI